MANINWKSIVQFGGPFIVWLSIVRLQALYSAISLPIFSLISPGEVLLSFFNLVTAVTATFFIAFIGIGLTFQEWLVKKWRQNKHRHNLILFISYLVAAAINFGCFQLALSYYDEHGSLYKSLENLRAATMTLLAILGLSIIYGVPWYRKHGKGVLLIFALILMSCFTLTVSFIQTHIILYSEYSHGVVISMSNGSKYKTSSKLKYAGKTADFVFLFDTLKKQTIVIKMENVDEISFPTTFSPWLY